MRVPLLSLLIIGVPLLTDPYKDVPLLIFFLCRHFSNTQW